MWGGGDQLGSFSGNGLLGAKGLAKKKGRSKAFFLVEELKRKRG